MLDVNKGPSIHTLCQKKWVKSDSRATASRDKSLGFYSTRKGSKYKSNTVALVLIGFDPSISNDLDCTIMMYHPADHRGMTSFPKYLIDYKDYR